MNKLPPADETQPEPESLTSEKPPIRVSQEEYVDDMATPSIDKSEYEQRGGNVPEPMREKEGERPTE